VRADAQAQGASAGVTGDPRRATAALGRAGLAQIVERSVAAIRQHRQRP
jgi:creatinine amidohydrolase/Fe(II)-dependent formamide hydrolase-like protein